MGRKAHSWFTPQAASELLHKSRQIASLKGEIDVYSKANRYSEGAAPFVRVAELVAKYQAGWLVEAGPLTLHPNQNLLIVIWEHREWNPGQSHSTRRDMTLNSAAAQPQEGEEAFSGPAYDADLWARLVMRWVENLSRADASGSTDAEKALRNVAEEIEERAAFV